MENSSLGKFFFREDDPHIIAKSLLGKILVRKHNDGRVQLGKIVEVEVYHGFDDLASHASKSRTKRNEVMFGKGGYYYVYLIYGMYWNLNIVTGNADFPSAILLRSLEPIFDSDINIVDLSFQEKFRLSSGPGKLCRWMGIDKSFYGRSVENNELYILPADKAMSIIDEYQTADLLNQLAKNKREKISSAKRVGVDYAGESANLHWRYYLANNKFVSKT